ncbi:hypothetical protein KAW18_06535 [candidate division WOR-3 bacterium]|nr:hypothetical protein [candidate division WOR-3 bacterium]MCK4527010.1 hypothetical protein [candidate division WOR-3 bacterium]
MKTRILGIELLGVRGFCFIVKTRKNKVLIALNIKEWFNFGIKIMQMELFLFENIFRNFKHIA